MKVIEAYDENFFYDLLKAKSYGFTQCKIINSIDSEDQKKKFHFEIFNSKITNFDSEFITFLMCIDYFINRSSLL